MSSSSFLSAPRKKREGGGLGMKTKKSRERNRRLRRSIWWWRGREKEKAATAAAVDTQTEKRKEGFGIFSSRLLLPLASKKGGSGQLTNSPKSQEERKKISCLLFQRQGKRGK